MGELVVAVGIFAVVILTLVALTASGIRAQRESQELANAALVARRQLERELDKVRQDSPAGTRAYFWDGDFTSSPFILDRTRVGPTEFTYAIYAHTVDDQISGAQLGTGVANNRLKRVEIVVNWWGSEQQQRQGYGKLSTRASVLVNEEPP